jgi:SAM-dependent methyltransferase
LTQVKDLWTPLQRDPLPARYAEGSWQRPFLDAIDPALKAGAAILDIGSGRHPTLAVGERPRGCHYVGLDISRTQLSLSPSGSYDEMVVADITTAQPRLLSRFDLIVSWQVLEHVKPLASALAYIRTYLRPGCRFVGHLSGTFSVFGLASRAIPHGIKVAAMQSLLARDPLSVFPAYYDRCWYSAIERMTRDDWYSFELLERHGGATYFDFSTVLQRLYLLYEEWTITHGYKDLATHYLMVGQL